MTVCVFIACAALVYWAAQLFAVLSVLRRVARLADAPRGGESVSIIVAARNEAEQVESATLSKLAQCGPGDEVILVDDRSCDATGELADRLALRDNRLRVIHINELAQGWLGKVHALNAGVKIAKGEWLVFSDADVHLRDGAISAALGHARKNGLDHLAVIPRLKHSGILIDSAIAVFVRLMALAPGMWNANAAKAGSAVGIGAFNLVRRAAFDKTPGFDWLRLEVIDDMGLALMIKKHGGKTAVADGSRFVELYFYRTIAQLRRGMEKGIFAGAQYSYLKLFCGIILFWLLEMSPFAAMFFGGDFARFAGAAALLPALAAALIMNRWSGRGIFAALLFPLGDSLGAALAFWCGISALASGGIVWRGTRYPLSELRKNRRFSFGG
jgi:cellulose synthase/poly-beta-1,6-N-acetylglucosamine synthase-like glycosyltransferase